MPGTDDDGRRAPLRLRAADAAALRSAVHVGRRPVGVALNRVGVLADRGVVWPALGAALAGAPRTRQAGISGLAAVAATSALTNAVKVVVRRRRPPAVLRLGAHSPGRGPTTWSFPSGHTASGLALAVAATVAQPPAGAPLLPLAAAVAASRLTTGRHHPSDVAAGVSIGVAIGLVAGVTARRLAARRERSERPAAR